MCYSGNAVLIIKHDLWHKRSGLASKMKQKNKAQSRGYALLQYSSFEPCALSFER
jgi:hypothetical protein